MPDITSFFFVDGKKFPLVNYGRNLNDLNGPSRSGSLGSGQASQYNGPTLAVQIVTADDHSLASWCIDGSVKSGKLTFQNDNNDGSSTTIQFVNGTCQSYSEGANADPPTLPVLISLYILPEKLIYGIN